MAIFTLPLTPIRRNSYTTMPELEPLAIIKSSFHRAPPPPLQSSGNVPAIDWVMAKGDGREVGFQDGGCFSRFVKREGINNPTFIAFLNCS